MLFSSIQVSLSVFTLRHKTECKTITDQEAPDSRTSNNLKTLVTSPSILFCSKIMNQNQIFERFTKPTIINKNRIIVTLNCSSSHLEKQKIHIETYTEPSKGTN